MSSRIKLRLDGLPRFETSPLFCTLEPSTEAALKRLPNAYERAIAALRFRQRINGDKNALGVSEDHVHIMQVAYLRAALMEYVAIEEVLPIDLAMRGLIAAIIAVGPPLLHQGLSDKGGIGTLGTVVPGGRRADSPMSLHTAIREKPLRILDTGNAMLIVLRELRHLQLHLVNTSFKSNSRSAVLRTRNNDKEFETELTVLTIPTADLRQLKTLRNAARFDSEELDAAISWFSHAQAQWGIGDVMQSGIQVYAAAIVQHYGLVAA